MVDVVGVEEARMRAPRKSASPVAGPEGGRNVLGAKVANALRTLPRKRGQQLRECSGVGLE